MTTTPPAPHGSTPDPTRGAPTPTSTGRRRPPGWAWALIGGIVVVAVVVAGIVIAGRDTANPHPAGTPTVGVSSSQATILAPSTTTSHTPTVTPTPSASPTVTGPAEVGGWTVEVLEYSPDVNDILAAADHPVTIEGHKWVGVKLRITNNDPDKAAPYTDLGRHIVGTSKGAYYEHYVDVGGYKGDEYLVSALWIEQGETCEGWLYYQVPGDFTPTGMAFKDDRLENSPEVFILMPTTD